MPRTFNLLLLLVGLVFLMVFVYEVRNPLSNTSKCTDIVHQKIKGLRQNPCRIVDARYEARCVRSFDPKLPTVMANTNGRLGNQMFAYASVYAMAIYNKRPGHMYPSQSDQLTKYFQLTLDTLDEHLFETTSWDIIYLTSKTPSRVFTLPKQNKLGYATRFNFGGYPCLWQYFHEFQKQIRQEFQFHPEIQAEVHKIIESTSIKFYPNSERSGGRVTVIGIHVRRGDYARDAKKLKLHLPTIQFYQVAMTIFTRKVKNPVFIVASDNIWWCTRAFRNLTSRFNIHFLKPKSKDDGGFDLAVLTKCRHIVYGIGSFGWWAGYLSEGVVIYCSDCEKDTFWLSKNGMYGGSYDNVVLPNWIGIPYNPNITNFTLY